MNYISYFAILLLTQNIHLCVYDIESNYLKHIFHFTMLRLIVLIFQKLPISKESNFFDINLFGIIRKSFPAKIETFMFLCMSKCYKTNTGRKPFVVVTVAIVRVRCKYSCVVSIVPIATAQKERLVQHYQSNPTN